MPKNRVSYNCQAIYVGPSPSTGYHFIDGGGNLNNNYEYSIDNFNLIKRLTRITDFNYSITLPRESIRQLGKSSLASFPVINSPSVQVDFEYYLNGVINEARLGFNVNHIKTDEFNSGVAIYDNENIFLFSGLSVYDEVGQPPDSPFWPASNRSSKNIFAIVTRGANEDEVISRNTLEEGTSYRDGNVVAFGDGYMTSYDTSCSVGNTPKARTSFVCDNVIFYTGSSGLAIPSVNPKNLENYSGIKFVIPEEAMNDDITVLLPGDILIDIQETGDSGYLQMNDITNFGVKFSDIKIQDYNISMRFDREDMTSIGYRAPASRRINFPIEINFNFSNLVGDESEAKLNEIIKLDKKYNVTIKMKDRRTRDDIVRYDFKNASVQDFGYTASINDDRKLSFNLRVNASPDNLNEGLFISGSINSARPLDVLLSQDGIDYLVTETDDRLITNLIPIY
jgi:hypothetical protein